MTSDTPAELSLVNPEEEDTARLAQVVAPHLRAGDLVVLSGGLGAGKTFFTRALCYALGLDEDEPVTSPTFTLAQEYPTKPPLVHADLYRLTDEEEVFELGLLSQREDGQILIVEWGAPFVDVLGGGAIFIDLALEPRRALLRGTSERARQLIEALSVDKSLSAAEKLSAGQTLSAAEKLSAGHTLNAAEKRNAAQKRNAALKRSAAQKLSAEPGKKK